jgi:hypothetical protein
MALVYVQIPAPGSALKGNAIAFKAGVVPLFIGPYGGTKFTAGRGKGEYLLPRQIKKTNPYFGDGVKTLQQIEYPALTPYHVHIAINPLLLTAL